jgi:hypothetical protein
LSREVLLEADVDYRGVAFSVLLLRRVNFNRERMAPGRPSRCYLQSIVYLEADLSQKRRQSEHHVPPTIPLYGHRLLMAVPPCLDLLLVRLPASYMYLFKGSTCLGTTGAFLGLISVLRVVEMRTVSPTRSVLPREYSKSLERRSTNTDNP